jgi:hypothetical protein
MTAEEFAQMPNCNLAEFIHNKWLQASDSKGGDLYVAIVDDYIRAFLLVVAYHQFLKGGAGGDGPSKEKLKLRCAQRRAQRTGDPAVLQKVLLDFEGMDEFCTRSPHLESAEVFGSQNRKPDTPLELTMRPTALTPSISLAFVSLREPQGLMFHLCPPSSRSPLRLCSRFPHPLPLLWIFAVSLLSKNLKWRRSSGILLVFLTIPLRNVGPCILSPRRNALPNLSPTPRAPLHRYTLEFGTTTNSQHLRSRSFFFAPTTLTVVSKVRDASGWTNSLLTKNDLRSHSCGLSKLVPTSLVRRS